MPEYSSVVGLSGVKIAPLQKKDGDYTATQIFDYPYAINMKVATDQSAEKQYADNRVVDIGQSTGSTTVEMEMRALSPEAIEALFGITLDAEGLQKYKSSTFAPWVAMSFVGHKNNKSLRHVGLLKGKFTIPDDELKTKEDKVDFQTVKLEGEFVPRDEDDVYKVVADEDAATFNQDAFFKFVYGDAYKSVPTTSAVSSDK